MASCTVKQRLSTRAVVCVFVCLMCGHSWHGQSHSALEQTVPLRINMSCSDTEDFMTAMYGNSIKKAKCWKWPAAFREQSDWKCFCILFSWVNAGCWAIRTSQQQHFEQDVYVQLRSTKGPCWITLLDADSSFGTWNCPLVKESEANFVKWSCFILQDAACSCLHALRANN